MAEFATFTGRNVDEAVNNALVKLQITSEMLEYEVVEKGSSGLLGFIGSKPAVIRARKRPDCLEEGREFLEKVFKEMNMTVDIAVSYNREEQTADIVLTGQEMGILIGKRGQTLDSLQHLVSLVINKHSENYIRVKLDTENYRERRKETLEQLAKNIAYKVRRTRRPASLEPMNPYERRIIHSTLQDDKYVYTKSEGEDPFRHVLIIPKKEASVQKKYYRSYDKDYGRNNTKSYGSGAKSYNCGEKGYESVGKSYGSASKDYGGNSENYSRPSKSYTGKNYAGSYGTGTGTVKSYGNGYGSYGFSSKTDVNDAVRANNAGSIASDETVSE